MIHHAVVITLESASMTGIEKKYVERKVWRNLVLTRVPSVNRLLQDVPAKYSVDQGIAYRRRHVGIHGCYESTVYDVHVRFGNTHDTRGYPQFSQALREVLANYSDGPSTVLGNTSYTTVRCKLTVCCEVRCACHVVFTVARCDECHFVSYRVGEAFGPDEGQVGPLQRRVNGRACADDRSVEQITPKDIGCLV